MTFQALRFGCIVDSTSVNRNSACGSFARSDTGIFQEGVADLVAGSTLVELGYFALRRSAGSSGSSNIRGVEFFVAQLGP